MISPADLAEIRHRARVATPTQAVPDREALLDEIDTLRAQLAEARDRGRFDGMLVAFTALAPMSCGCTSRLLVAARDAGIGVDDEAVAKFGSHDQCAAECTLGRCVEWAGHAGHHRVNVRWESQ